MNHDKFLKSLNYFVNNKFISLMDIKKKNLKLHARFSDKERIYKYVIFKRYSITVLEK